MDPPQEDTSGELSHGGRCDSEQAEWSGIMAQDQICSLVTGPGTTAGFCRVWPRAMQEKGRVCLAERC